MSALVLSPSSFTRLSSATPSVTAEKTTSQPHSASKAFSICGPVPQSAVKPSYVYTFSLPAAAAGSELSIAMVPIKASNGLRIVAPPFEFKERGAVQQRLIPPPVQTGSGSAGWPEFWPLSRSAKAASGTPLERLDR